MVLDSWFYEVIAICFSVACFMTLFYILQIYDQSPQPKFSYGLTLNTIVSVLATASKTSLIFLVGECIGQLRWASFRGTSNPLLYIQTYDSASRGPWGSILILIKDKCRSPVTIGAVITILALAFDPFVQQIITYDVRDTQAFSPAAKLKQSRTMKVPVTDEVNLNFTSALSTAVWMDQSSLDPACPSGDCTWPLFTQVEMCSKCEDATNEAVFIGCDKDFDWTKDVEQDFVFCSVSIPGSASSSTNVTQIKVIANNWNFDDSLNIPLKIVWPSFKQSVKSLRYINGTDTTLEESYDSTDTPILLSNQTYAGMVNPLLGFAYIELNVPENATIQMNSSSLLRGLSVKKASRCGLAFCARTYKVSVSNGTTSSTVIDEDFGVSYLSTQKASASYATSWRSNSTKSAAPDGSVIVNGGREAADSSQFDFSYTVESFGNFNLEGGTKRRFYCGGIGCSANAAVPSGYESNSSVAINSSGPAQKVVHDGGLEITMKNIASSITQYARDTSDSALLGTMGTTDSYVHVRWPWLILPAVLIVLGVILLGTTAYISAKLKLWKTSVLPFLYHGLDKGLVPEGDELGCMSQMEGAADTVTVRLEYSDPKQRLMLRGGFQESKTPT